MTLVFFSDIHGNRYAMSALAARLGGTAYDRAYFLGDIMGYGYSPYEVFKMLQQIPRLTILKGNHDQMACEVAEGQLKVEPLVEKYGQVYAMVGSDFAVAVRALPCQCEFVCEGKRYGLFHGLPGDPLNGRLYPADKCEDVNRFADYDFVFCGHTHFRMDRQIGGTRVVGVGSAGQPRDFLKPCYVIFDTCTESVDFVGFDYDRELLSQEVDKFDAGNAKLKELIWRYNS